MSDSPQYGTSPDFAGRYAVSGAVSRSGGRLNSATYLKTMRPLQSLHMHDLPGGYHDPCPTNWKSIRSACRRRFTSRRPTPCFAHRVDHRLARRPRRRRGVAGGGTVNEALVLKTEAGGFKPKRPTNGATIRLKGSKRRFRTRHARRGSRLANRCLPVLTLRFNDTGRNRKTLSRPRIRKNASAMKSPWPPIASWPATIALRPAWPCFRLELRLERWQR